MVLMVGRLDSPSVCNALLQKMYLKSQLIFRYYFSTIESTGSSDDSADYDGDVECSLLSESEQIIETFLEEPLEERGEPPNVNCQNDPQGEERTLEGTRF